MSRTHDNTPGRPAPKRSAEGSWFAKLARSLQAIADNLDTPVSYTACREITAQALGLSGDHEATRLIERGAFPEHRPDHQVPAGERESRRTRQIAVLRESLKLDGEQTEAAWLAWRPTGNLRAEALERLPLATTMVSLSDIAGSPGSRMDARFHLVSRHIAQSSRWDWKNPGLRRQAMRLAEVMETTGPGLDRPYPDQVFPTDFRSEAQARAFLQASCFYPIHVLEFARNIAPYPDTPEGYIKIYADLSGAKVSYRIGTNVTEIPEDQAS